MTRQNLPATLCFLAWTALCGLASAQTAPATPPSGLPPVSLPAQIESLVSDPSVSRAHWGIMVTNLDGAPIFALNEAQFFQPASNAKLFTTAAALALLGPDKTVETQVVGTLKGSTVTGDLALIGAADANLSGRQLPYVSPGSRPAAETPSAPPDPLRYLEDMAGQVAAKGVTQIDGDVVGYDTLFPWEPYPSDWSIDDMVWGYGAPVSALTINDNQIKVTITPAAAPGHPATVQLLPDTPYYTIDLNVRTTPAKTGGQVQFERAPGSKVLRIYGSIAAGSPPYSEEVAIQDPAEYAAIALKAMLEARGISVKGAARAMHWSDFDDPRGFLSQTRQPIDAGQTSGSQAVMCAVPNWPQARRAGDTVLATHQSVPLVEDVTATNKVSQNLHAELFLHRLGLAFTCYGTAAQGARVVRQFLTANAGIDPADFVLYDGSGLSGHDLVTPRAIAQLLHFATTQPWFAAWKASFPVGGEDGTLGGRFAKPPLKDHIFAKTGTLGEARALSGFLDTASGRTVIFSVMVTDHMPGSPADRDTMDKIIAAIQAAE